MIKKCYVRCHHDINYNETRLENVIKLTKNLQNKKVLNLLHTLLYSITTHVLSIYVTVTLAKCVLIL